MLTDSAGIYQNKKIFKSSRKRFEIPGWRPRIWRFFEISRTIYSNSERPEQFLVTECFLTCSCRFLISNKFKHLLSKLEKKIEIEKQAWKVRKFSFPNLVNFKSCFLSKLRAERRQWFCKYSAFPSFIFCLVVRGSRIKEYFKISRVSLIWHLMNLLLYPNKFVTQCDYIAIKI